MPPSDARRCTPGGGGYRCQKGWAVLVRAASGTAVRRATVPPTAWAAAGLGLLALPDRRAFLGERQRALAGIRRGEHRPDDLALPVEGLRSGPVGGLYDHPLGGGERQRPAQGDSA